MSYKVVNQRTPKCLFTSVKHCECNSHKYSHSDDSNNLECNSHNDRHNNDNLSTLSNYLNICMFIFCIKRTSVVSIYM